MTFGPTSASTWEFKTINIIGANMSKRYDALFLSINLTDNNFTVTKMF